MIPKLIRPSVRWLVVIVVCAVMLLTAGLLIRAKRRSGNEKETAAASVTLMNKPLPEANLIDSSGLKLADNALRKGKVLLIFVAPNCPPCQRESEFLKPLMEKRKDVSYYGVVSFGATQAGLKSIENEFPFKSYFDGDPRLAGAMGLYRVPIKIFLNDGVLRKSWKGASSDEATKAAFTAWLQALD
jgi:thiol-disulfide isomerase/thioredoxin